MARVRRRYDEVNINATLIPSIFSFSLFFFAFNEGKAVFIIREEFRQREVSDGAISRDVWQPYPDTSDERALFA